MLHHVALVVLTRATWRNIPEDTTLHSFLTLWTWKYCTSYCQQTMTEIYDSWSRGSCSAVVMKCLELVHEGYWYKWVSLIPLSESVVRTTAVSLPSAVCTGLVFTKLHSMGGSYNSMVQILSSLPYGLFLVSSGWRGNSLKSNCGRVLGNVQHGKNLRPSSGDRDSELGLVFIQEMDIWNIL
jgi:hypothetical protein